MSLESGSFALTVFRLPGKLPDDILEKFSAKSAGKLDELKDEVSVGWVSGRHLLEREIDETTCILGGHVHLNLRISQRKIPNALLKAECRKEELEYMLQNNVQHMPSKVRREIRKNIMELRISQMPPVINGIPLVIDKKAGFLYFASASQKVTETFLDMLYQTIKLDPARYDIDELCYKAFKQKSDALDPLNFAEKPKDKSHCPGRDFLTWLWFFSEAHNGKIKHHQYGEFELFIDGPFTLAFGEEAAGEGAAETVVRNGNPAKSAEVKAALSVGKKLRKAKITLNRGKEIWKTSFDADRFTFSGFNLPEGEELEQNSAFSERINNIYIFFEIFGDLFAKFADATKPENRKKSEKEIINWAKERDSL